VSQETTAELRRLAALKAQLLEALQSIAEEFAPGDDRKTYGEPMEAMDRIRAAARSAIAAATEGGVK
jgi:hypothetical protein